MVTSSFLTGLDESNLEMTEVLGGLLVGEFVSSNFLRLIPHDLCYRIYGHAAYKT